MTTTPLEYPRNDPDELSLRDHRRLVGCLGMLLPISLYVIAGARPTDGLPTWSFLDSVSAYYYSGAGALFVGVIFAISLFLWTYRGYKNVKADRYVGRTSGVAAACVALFPTRAPNEELEPTWWKPWVGYVHHIAAVVLFSSFIVFALWLFRMTAVKERDERPPDKKRRDAVCLACGVIMIGAVIWATVAGLRDGSILWPEAIAIESFALSWLVKGEAHKPLVNAVRRALGRRRLDPVS